MLFPNLEYTDFVHDCNIVNCNYIVEATGYAIEFGLERKRSRQSGKVIRYFNSDQENW